MLKVIVEKCEHGGFIAKQYGDNPLRYVAAAGDTEAAACAALFDYHGDLIRKGRIHTDEVKGGMVYVKPPKEFARPGDTLPIGYVFDPADHGAIVPKAAWNYVFSLAAGLETYQNFNPVDMLVCRTVRGCLVSIGLEQRLYIEPSVKKFLKAALEQRNQSPVYGKFRKLRGFNTVEGHVTGSDGYDFLMGPNKDTLETFAAVALYHAKQDTDQLYLDHMCAQITDFVECLVHQSPAPDRAIELFSVSLENQYLRAMLSAEGKIPKDYVWAKLVHDRGGKAYTTDLRLPLNPPTGDYTP